MAEWVKTKRTWMPKRKVINMLDKRAVELAADMDYADGEELDKLTNQITKIEDLKEQMKKPKVPKEVWVEALKVVGAAAMLAAVVYYDSKGHVLPKSLDAKIPWLRL